MKDDYERWAEDFDIRHMRDNERRMDREWKRARANRAARRAAYVETIRVKRAHPAKLETK